jgi:hypothetical protein
VKHRELLKAHFFVSEWGVNRPESETVQAASAIADNNIWV